MRPCWCCRPGRAGSHCWSQPPEQQAQVDRPLRARPGSLRPPPAARTHLDKSVGTQQSVDDLTHRRIGCHVTGVACVTGAVLGLRWSSHTTVELRTTPVDVIFTHACADDDGSHAGPP